MKRLILFLLFAFCAAFPALAAGPMAASLWHYTATCDGVQRWASRALDYGSTMYLRDVKIMVWDAEPQHYVTLTVSYDHVVYEAQVNFAQVIGAERQSLPMAWGGNSYTVPPGQALAIEYKCTGGGAVNFGVNVFYSASP